MRNIFVVLVLAFVFFNAQAAFCTTFCPESKLLPQFTIDRIERSDFAIYDEWQVFYDGTPISDVQLTIFAEHDFSADIARADIGRRGRNVFWGMLGGAFGTAISSIGWVLYGQDQVSSALSLSMALSGIAMTLVGTIFISESIQVPLEPFLAPTPRHRFSRGQARDLVFEANKRLNRKICAAIQEDQHS